MTEFAKWLADMPNECPPQLIVLYNRAIIAKTFPAYTLESVGAANAPQIFQALERLDAAQKLKA